MFKEGIFLFSFLFSKIFNFKIIKFLNIQIYVFIILFAKIFLKLIFFHLAINIQNF
jgi:hypothetical protein